MYISYIKHDFIGNIVIKGNDKAICSIELNVEEVPKEFKENETTKKCKKELMEYFKGKRKEFDIPLELEGSEFQLEVWGVLKKIPYGDVISYYDEAVMYKEKKYARAVSNANNKNPIPIIIPCHRVKQKDGYIGGYKYGVDIKKYLLRLEEENR